MNPRGSRRRGILAVVCLAVTWTVSAAAASHTPQLPASDPQGWFDSATEEYSNGLYRVAAERFQLLMDRGYGSPSLEYNLGCALVRAGEAGRGMLHYRRAWYDRPRDADLSRNMRLVGVKTGAGPPPHRPGSALFALLPVSGWAKLASAGYWTVWLFLAWAAADKTNRRAAGRLLLVPGLSLACGLAGMGWWAGLRRYPEAVTLVPRQPVRLAPTPAAQVTFALAEASVVRTLEQSGDWIKIATEQRNGWVPAHAVAMVRPPPAPAPQSGRPATGK